MGNKSIVAVDIAKRYRIGMKEQIHDSLVGAVMSWAKYPIANYRRLRRLSRFNDLEEADDIIWALRDVSFAVDEGEVLGIIGSNGAGKSTLLKVLSRITDPTKGRIEISGKVSSLLEVGTGFHPELTGRENVYLNGTIIGMGKKEIDKKLDQIVSFSGVEKFIDTPIKRYSTGMSVRLAFAVAAHIEPEVLIIDEVLAVGDHEFQQKCLGRMQGVAKEGRTVLFVSHNMAAVNRLCHNVLWLDNGMVKSKGPTQDIIKDYLSHGSVNTPEWINACPNSTEKEVFLESMRLRTKNGHPTTSFKFGEPFEVEIDYRVNERVDNLSICFQLYNSAGTQVLEARDTDIQTVWAQARKRGKYRSFCEFNPNQLMPDRYIMFVSAFVEKVKLIHHCENVLNFEITKIEEQGADLKPWRKGIISPNFNWNIGIRENI